MFLVPKFDLYMQIVFLCYKLLSIKYKQIYKICEQKEKKTTEMRWNKTLGPLRANQDLTKINALSIVTQNIFQ